MNEDRSIRASAQADGLVEAIEYHRADACECILAEARDEADQVVAEARSRALKRFRQAKRELRTQARHSIARARAMRETQERKVHQQALAATTARARPRLREAVEERWMGRETRQTWMHAALASGKERLFAGSWRIVCPRPDGETIREEVLELCASLGLDAPEITASDDLTAGLRIEAHGAALDATPDALLSRGESVEAVLIAEIERLSRSMVNPNKQ